MNLTQRQEGRCRVCNGPAHPRTHLVDPVTLGLSLRRRDDYAPRPIHSLPVWLRRRQEKQARGQTLVEYGLLLALIAIMVIVALLFLGPVVSQIFQQAGENLQR